MTTYDMIEALIRNKAMKMGTARSLILDAYERNKIDSFEYEELVELARKYL